MQPPELSRAALQFLQRYAHPQCQFDTNARDHALRVQLPALLTYDYDVHPEYTLRVRMDTNGDMCVQCTRRDTKEVVQHILPRTTSFPYSSSSSSSSFPSVRACSSAAGGVGGASPHRYRHPRAIYASTAAAKQEVRAGEHLRLFFSRRRATFLVACGSACAPLRGVLVVLGMAPTDALMLPLCVPFTHEDDMCVHFAAAARHATLLAAAPGVAAATRAVAARLCKKEEGKSNKLERTMLLVAMAREWYLRFFPTGTAQMLRATRQLPRLPARFVIEGATAKSMRRVAAVWRRAVRPALDTAVRETGAVPACNSAMLVAAVDACWRAHVHHFAALLAAPPPPAAVYHRLFEMVSTDLARDDMYALHAFLRAGAPGWVVRDIHEDLCYTVEDHARAISVPSQSFASDTERSAAAGAALDLWIDHRPFGFVTGPRIEDWPDDFHTLFVHAAGIEPPDRRCFVSFSLDWVRRRLHIFTHGGRLGQWLQGTASPAPPRSHAADDDNQSTPTSTVGTEEERGCGGRSPLRWIDYQSEMRHVELGVTHDFLDMHWAQYTWLDASVAGGGARLPPLLAALVLPDRERAIAAETLATDGMVASAIQRCVPHEGGMCRRALHAPWLQMRDTTRVSEEVSVVVGLQPHLGDARPCQMLVNQASADRGVLSRTFFEVHDDFDPARGDRVVQRAVGSRVNRGDVLGVLRAAAPAGAPLAPSLRRARGDGYVCALSATRVVLSKLHVFDSGAHIEAGCTPAMVDAEGQRWVAARFVPEHLMPFDALTGAKPDLLLLGGIPPQTPFHHLLSSAVNRTHTAGGAAAGAAVRAGGMGGAPPMVSPATGRVIEGSEQWTWTSMYVARENVELPPAEAQDNVQQLQQKLVDVHIDPVTGALAGRAGGAAHVQVHRAWWERQAPNLQRALALGQHPFLFTEDMLPYRWDLAGWSAASCALFTEAFPTAEKQRAVVGGFSPHTPVIQGAKRAAREDEDEEEDAPRSYEYEPYHEDDDFTSGIGGRAGGAGGGGIGGVGDAVPHFEWSTYWSRFAAPHDGVLQLQEQSRAFVEERTQMLGTRSAWTMNAHKNRFRNKLSGRVMPFIDPRTLFILQTKNKFAHATFPARPHPADAESTLPPLLELPGDEADRAEWTSVVPDKRVPGIYNVGDVVLLLSDPIRTRKWRVRAKMSDAVCIIELLPNESTAGLNQLSRVALAQELWHFVGFVGVAAPPPPPAPASLGQLMPMMQGQVQGQMALQVQGQGQVQGQMALQGQTPTMQGQVHGPQQPVPAGGAAGESLQIMML